MTQLDHEKINKLASRPSYKTKKKDNPDLFKISAKKSGVCHCCKTPIVKGNTVIYDLNKDVMFHPKCRRIQFAQLTIYTNEKTTILSCCTLRVDLLHLRRYPRRGNRHQSGGIWDGGGSQLLVAENLKTLLLKTPLPWIPNSQTVRDAIDHATITVTESEQSTTYMSETT